MEEAVGPRLYSCYKCRNHVALHDDIISKAFFGKTWPSFSICPCNEHCSRVQRREASDNWIAQSADVYCSDCRQLLGWQYEKAYEESQKYKEGKYILEKPNIFKENW